MKRTEKPEATGLGSEVKGFSVNPEGESRHRHVRAKMARKERENQTRMEKKANQCASQEEGAEVQSPERKVIRVESEETQDYVRESLNLSREEAEEISFVPSALSFPRGPMFRCDNRCSDKGLRFWQLASAVVDDGEEAHIINLCQQCYNERLTAQGQAPLKSWQWKAVVEQKAHRVGLWTVLEKDQFIQGMREYFSLEIAKAKKFLKDLEKEEEEGIQSQWQQESLAKQVFGSRKNSADTDCTYLSSRNDEVWILCIERRRLGGIQKEPSRLK